LREAGVVSEEVASVGDGRRRPTKLRLDERAAYAVGIQLSRSGLSVVATDFSAKVLAWASSEVAASEGPEVVVSALREQVDSVVGRAGLPEEKILGAGLGMPGPGGPEIGRMLDPSFAGWSGYPLEQELEHRLRMPVRVENDATAAALGERWNGVAGDVSDFVYVYLGNGVGAGIFANHQVYRGSSGNSGEIGHVSIESDGPPCYCGNRGCLEVYATPQGILREARGVALRTSHLPGVTGSRLPGCVEDVVQSEEPAFRAVVEAAGDRLGRALSGVVGVLDPELIVLGGPTVGLVGARFAASVVRGLQDTSLPVRPVARVELSSIGADAGPVGAAALVLHDTYAPSMQRLSLA